MSEHGRRSEDGDSRGLVEWRLSSLESTQAKLALALEEIIAQVRTAKYVIAFGIGIIQPVVIGVFIHYMTR